MHAAARPPSTDRHTCKRAPSAVTTRTRGAHGIPKSSPAAASPERSRWRQTYRAAAHEVRFEADPPACRTRRQPLRTGRDWSELGLRRPSPELGTRLCTESREVNIGQDSQKMGRHRCRLRACEMH